MTLTKFLVKSTARIALVGFTIKVICDTNAFSTNSKETEEKFQQLVTEIVPGTLGIQKQLVTMKDGARDEYNKTVDGIFTAINYFPATVSNFAKSCYKFPLLEKKIEH
ncbi:Hypothetical protein SRAE_2000315500 [Strongyloides ratti]|uniref:MICOS complex subunit MIC13 n=1 Tax=Strongyloides ratti TaxID=34506 RepID=A0A090LK30_STRRB|nr:Hypothetical protein SRAE_2000315500 [Strongyloides ratti]CEF68498.1 Hypothetical protein SRAE_2000315500 [Strongyloides ratti]